MCYITLKSNQEAFGMNAEEQDLIDNVTRKALRKRKKENSNLQDEKSLFYCCTILLLVICLNNILVLLVEVDS